MPSVSPLMRFVWVLCLVVTVLANTETLVVDRTAFVPSNRHSPILLEPVGNGTYASDVSVSFAPVTLVRPDDNHQQNTAVVDLSALPYGHKYFIKVCWSAMNPVDIALDSPDNNLLVITATTDYYADNRAQAAQFLSHVTLQVRAQPNDRLFNLLTADFVQLIEYIGLVALLSVLASHLIYRQFFTTPKLKSKSD